jgi:hypothetical protein
VRVTGLLLFLALAQEKEKPVAFESRGKLVCLLEEMKDKYQADASPIHDHLAGFRVEGDAPAGGFRYYTLLRNAFSEALFVDARFKEHELRLSGRVFPSSSLLEVSRFQWYRDGKLFNVYYWCSICAIRGVDPGPCSCCKEKVELREERADGAKK